MASCPVDPIDAPRPDDVGGAASRAHGLRQGRYGVVVGRVDPAKGSDDAERFTTRYRQAVDPDFQLVVVGPGGGAPLRARRRGGHRLRRRGHQGRARGRRRAC